MAITEHPGAPQGTSLEQISIWLLQGLFAVGCIFYAVMAFDYFISFAADRQGLWTRVFTLLSSREHALGSGSVHVDQKHAYTEGYRFMLMHTTMGAFALAVGPFQFMGKIRRRYPAAHRLMGKIYLIGAVLSMFAGIAYLSSTAFQEVYSGTPFAIALYALDLAVLYTAWLAYSAIRRRDVMRHQAWMAFNFGLLFATPLLRILWVAFAWAFPGVEQAQNNLGITTFLLPLSLFGAMIWITAQRPAVPSKASNVSSDLS